MCVYVCVICLILSDIGRLISGEFRIFAVFTLPCGTTHVTVARCWVVALVAVVACARAAYRLTIAVLVVILFTANAEYRSISFIPFLFFLDLFGHDRVVAIDDQLNVIVDLLSVNLGEVRFSLAREAFVDSLSHVVIVTDANQVHSVV